MVRKNCSDPLQRHKTKVTKTVRRISNKLFMACNNTLAEDTMLCDNCRKKIANNPDILKELQLDECSSMQTHSPAESSSSIAQPSSSSDENEDISIILKELDVTPIKKRKYLFQLCCKTKHVLINRPVCIDS